MLEGDFCFGLFRGCFVRTCFLCQGHPKHRQGRLLKRAFLCDLLSQLFAARSIQKQPVLLILGYQMTLPTHFST